MRVGMERRVAFNVLDTNDSYCHYNHSCRHYPYVIVVAIMLPCGAASSSTMVGSKSSLCTTDCTLQVMACTGEIHHFLPVKSPICDLRRTLRIYGTQSTEEKSSSDDIFHPVWWEKLKSKTKTRFSFWFLSDRLNRPWE